MSNVKTFSLEEFKTIRFLSLEHGDSAITLSIVESNPHKSMEIMLGITDARAIMDDIGIRINEITQEKT